MDLPDKPSTPPEPTRTPAEPTREPTPGAYLPPKLREKLEGADDGSDWEPKGPSPLPWIVVAVLVIAGGAWVFMGVRANAAKRKAAEELRVAQVRADSIAAAARADSIRALMQDTTAMAAAALAGKPGQVAPASGASAASNPSAPKPGTTQTAGGSKTGSSAASAPASGGGPYGLAVATYLFEDRALSEKERLTAATGLPGRVVTRTEGGATVYRLILGSFESRSVAQRKAEELTGQNVVAQASVVPLSR